MADSQFDGDVRAKVCRPLVVPTVHRRNRPKGRGLVSRSLAPGLVKLTRLRFAPMNLYLMRHGIAVTADQPGVESDGERALTPKGIKRMRRAVRGLRRLGISFDAILTSPLVRARQTAEIVADTHGMDDHLEEIP